jgi:uncharacterized protein YbjT (DUF2867 family)
MIPKKYVAAIIGGSGSVGKHVVKSILADPQCEKVILVSRRELDDVKALNPDKITVKVCDPLDDLEKIADLGGTNVAFCTLGHGSSRKSTKDDLLRVDATIPGAFARACKEAGVTHYCLMTAVGSDENSEWSPLTKTSAGGGWYAHVKGVAERLTLEAEIPYTYIAQPGMLLGSPHTPKIFQYLPNFFFPAAFSSAHVADIAKGMVATTIGAFQKETTGVVKISGGIPISEGKTE